MNVYEPIRIIEIDGAVLPTDISDNVESFSYEDHEDKLDELRITIVDPTLELCDHPMLQEGQEIRARWGYIGNLSEMRVCTIKEIEYNFPQDGTPRISISAFDKGHKLTGRSARTCWSNKKLEDIVSDIAKKHNFTPVIEIPSDSKREFVSQGGKNDMEFLRGLASDMGCKVWVKNDELHFEPYRINTPTQTYIYGIEQEGTLLSFNVTVNAEKDKGTGLETEVSGIDPITKKPFKETTTATKEGYAVNMQNGRVEKETPPAQKHDETGQRKATPSHTKHQAQQEAKGKVQTLGMGAVEGRAEIIGDPHLKAKDSIQLENVSKKLSGVWRVKKVLHSIGKEGYTSSLEIVRNDTNATSSSGKPANKSGTNGKGTNTAGNDGSVEVNLGDTQ